MCSLRVNNNLMAHNHSLTQLTNQPTNQHMTLKESFNCRDLKSLFLDKLHRVGMDAQHVKYYMAVFSVIVKMICTFIRCAFQPEFVLGQTPLSLVQPMICCKISTSSIKYELITTSLTSCFQSVLDFNINQSQGNIKKTTTLNQLKTVGLEIQHSLCIGES